VLSSAAAWPLAARARQPTKLPTIGYLGTAVPSAWSPWTAAFVQRLRELSWIEGRTVAIEYRWAEGRPTLYPNREYLQAGGLISYGPSFSDLFLRAADYVDKILRGAKPGSLPVEQPTKFELVINLTAAKALRINIPPTLLARADEVIE
jgi:ABC transporter substrate binding protein